MTDTAPNGDQDRVTDSAALKKCCCGDPVSQTETMGGCGNCFVGAHDSCEAPVWVDSRGVIVRRTVVPLG